MSSVPADTNNGGGRYGDREINRWGGRKIPAHFLKNCRTRTLPKYSFIQLDIDDIALHYLSSS
eukprot:scaffold555_cov158-Skeletonema_menzelii.AAC.17